MNFQAAAIEFLDGDTRKIADGHWYLFGAQTS